MPSNSGSKNQSDRRSVCPVACTLDILGDKWTLLVVRDLFLGKSRFGEFSKSPEGIPTNILTERLERLTQHGVIEQVPLSPTAKRMGYQLTEKGRALKQILLAMKKWGLEWEEGTEARLERKKKS